MPYCLTKVLRELTPAPFPAGGRTEHVGWGLIGDSTCSISCLLIFFFLSKVNDPHAHSIKISDYNNLQVNISIM